MYLILFIILLNINILYIYANINKDNNNINNNEKQDRKIRHKTRINKKYLNAKINLSGSLDSNSHTYGSELPSFSFDYTEFIVSSIIERSSDSDDLYLTMFLIGHKAIVHDYPFESISTDEEVMFQWGQALKKWRPERNVSSTHASGYICVIKNNDNKNNPPYHTSAQWIPFNSIDNNNFRGNFEILRCKIKGSTNVYEELSHTDLSLYVDIVRRRDVHSKFFNNNNSNNSNINIKNDNFFNNSTEDSSHDQSAAIISFSVPWKSRQNGYGFQFKNNSSTFDSWQTSSIISSSSLSSHIQDNNKNITNKKPSYFACVSGLRPLHPLGYV